jgi:hypothetical protein
LRAKITLVVCSILLLAAGNTAAPLQIDERKPSTQDQEMAERRKKEFNKQRRKEIIADAEKILGLAGEIKQGIGSDEAAPSPGVIEKLEKMEKLARKIKTKMQENANITDARGPVPARRTNRRASRLSASASGF